MSFTCNFSFGFPYFQKAFIIDILLNIPSVCLPQTLLDCLYAKMDDFMVPIF